MGSKKNSASNIKKKAVLKKIKISNWDFDLKISHLSFHANLKNVN
jgi:hypothetical protein